MSGPPPGPAFSYGPVASVVPNLIDPAGMGIPQAGNNRANAMMASSHGMVPTPQLMHYSATNNNAEYADAEEVPSTDTGGTYDEQYVDGDGGGDCDEYGSPRRMSCFMEAVRRSPRRTFYGTRSILAARCGPMSIIWVSG